MNITPSNGVAASGSGLTHVFAGRRENIDADKSETFRIAPVVLQRHDTTSIATPIDVNQLSELGAGGAETFRAANPLAASEFSPQDFLSPKLLPAASTRQASGGQAIK